MLVFYGVKAVAQVYLYYKNHHKLVVKLLIGKCNG